MTELVGYFAGGLWRLVLYCYRWSLFGFVLFLV